MSIPTPLQTILSPTRYPFAVAQVKDGKITSTLAYQDSLEECYFQVQGWRSSMGSAAYIMAEQQEINGKSYWVAVWSLAQEGSRLTPSDPYTDLSSNNRPMQRLDVICPSAPWENTTTDEDRAWDLCLSLSEEYGYAQVRQNGIIIGDYTNGGV
jgi:hypothetical protein